MDDLQAPVSTPTSDKIYSVRQAVRPDGVISFARCRPASTRTPSLDRTYAGTTPAKTGAALSRRGAVPGSPSALRFALDVSLGLAFVGSFAAMVIGPSWVGYAAASLSITVWLGAVIVESVTVREGKPSRLLNRHGQEIGE